MTTIYLIRHGQAGSRDNYDLLSELGQRQARLLGDYFARQQINLSTVYSGALKRQQQTAQLMIEQLGKAGVAAPEIKTDDSWNEFSLANVYQGLVPRLMADLPEFAADYQAMQDALLADPHTVRGATGRCDRTVIEAWMQNRYLDYDGQSWAAFRARARLIALTI